MKIKEINKNDLVEYTKFTSKYNYIFNRPEWIKIYGDKIRLYGMYDGDGRLVGIFNLYFSQKGFLTHIKNAPYSPTISLFFENNAKNKANFISNEKAVFTAISNFFDTLSYSILTVSFPLQYSDMQAFIWKNFKVIPNYTYRYNIQALSEKDLFSNLSSERRNDIKKAEKDGIRIELTHDYTLVKGLVLKTFSRKNKAIDSELVDKILFEFSNKTNSFAFVAYKNSLPISCSFCMQDGITAYYLLGGYDNNNKHQGAGACVLWNAIVYSQKAGLAYFDFEGSMIQPVEKFFRGFGADIVPYYTLNKANIALEMILKIFKRSQF